MGEGGCKERRRKEERITTLPASPETLVAMCSCSIYNSTYHTSIISVAHSEITQLPQFRKLMRG